MILLIQVFHPKTEAWSDMEVPRATNKSPARGVFPLVTNVEDFAEQLVRNKLTGRYRVFLGVGSLWTVVITRRDDYYSTIAPVPA